jgi:alpha-tubulin suppressor-like RCC1 family protein
LSNVVAVASGSSHNLALKKDGKIVVWGKNTFGQTNLPPDLSNVVSIAAGSVHSLALKKRWHGGEVG